MVGVVQTIRRLLISEARPVGYDKLAGDINKTKTAQDGLARSTDKAVKEQLSAARAADKLRMSIDSEYRASVQMARGQQVLNRALEQGTIDAREYGRQLDLLAAKHRKVDSARGGISAGFVGGFVGGAVLDTLYRIPQAAGQAIQAIDSINDAAARAGTSAKDIQALRFALEQTGGTADDADRGMLAFMRRTQEAARENNALAKFLKINNVEIEKNKDLLSDFARLVQNAPSQGAALDIGRMAFGGSAEEWMPLLREGPAAIAKMRAEAERLRPLSEDMVKRGGELADDYARIAQIIQNDWMRAVVTFGDTSGRVFDYLVQRASIIARVFEGTFSNERIGQAFRTLPAGGAATAAGSRDAAISALRSGMGGKPTGAPTKYYGTGASSSASSPNEYQQQVKTIREQTEALRVQAATVGMATDAVARFTATEQLLNAAKEAGIPITAKLRAEIDAQAQSLGAATKYNEELRASAERVKQAYQQAGEYTNDFFQNLIINGQSAQEALSGLLKQMASDLLRFAITGQGPMAALMGGGAAGSSGLFGLLGGMFGGSPAATGSSTMFGGPRAQGGSVWAGQSYMVGERGPELFAPRSNGQIIPNSGGSNVVNVTINGAVGNSEVRGLVAQGVAVGLSNERTSFRDRVTGATRDSSSRRVRLA